MDIVNDNEAVAEPLFLIRLGIKIERGTVAAIAVDSSAAKNGLLIGHHIIGGFFFPKIITS